MPTTYLEKHMYMYTHWCRVIEKADYREMDTLMSVTMTTMESCSENFNTIWTKRPESRLHRSLSSLLNFLRQRTHGGSQSSGALRLCFDFRLCPWPCIKVQFFAVISHLQLFFFWSEPDESFLCCGLLLACCGFMQAEYKSKMCHYDPPFAVFNGAANRNRVTTFTTLTGCESDELVWVKKNKTKQNSKNKKNE